MLFTFASSVTYVILYPFEPACFFFSPNAKNYINYFFSSITDKTKSGKVRICFKTESVILILKSELFFSGYRSWSKALKVILYSGYTFYSTKI
jgi:hypothetical protein